MALRADYRRIVGREVTIHGDRRTERRYECQLELRFESRSRGASLLGHGVTADLSRGTLRFQTDSPPPIGHQTEVRIAWPFLLQNVCRLELVVRGPVIRTGARGTIMGISSYEFQTCGERSFGEAPAPATGWRVA
jgi:hypothetical protein